MCLFAVATPPVDQSEYPEHLYLRLAADGYPLDCVPLSQHECSWYAGEKLLAYRLVGVVQVTTAPATADPTSEVTPQRDTPD